MKGRILTSLLTVIALTGLQAQNIPAVPRLVVGLTIDQLRTDYIEAFSALYGERGFKRLWREGRIYRNAEYDFINVDKSSAVAAIYSGTTPYTNGIVGDNWMDRSTLRVLNCVDDADSVSYTHLRAHETGRNLVCRLLLEKKIPGYAVSPAYFMD